MPFAAVRLFALFLLSALMAGCAASSVFTPYPSTAKDYRMALTAGQPDAAIQKISPKTDSADGMLYLLEKGRITQVAGQSDDSLTDFDAAIARFRHQDDRAIVSASSYAASGASLLVNDNTRPYEGRTYERVFVHQYQALNYLARGDVTGALVEVRRANQIQVNALAQKDATVDAARSDAEQKGLDTNRYDNYFSSMDLAAGRVKTGFQNAATFYLSGLIYEATGSVNDAYIDYRKALELVPDNPYLQKDVVRTGLRTGLDDVRRLAQQIGYTPAPNANAGDIVVYVEEGFVPEKRSIGIPIWTTRTLNTVSFPIYGDSPAPSPVVVQIDGQSLPSALLVDTRALAVRTLKDEVPGLLARAFLRLLTKQEMQRQAQSHDNSGLLSLATTVYSLVTDRPDLRSWLTLPGSGQIIRLSVPEGDHTLSLPGLAPVTVSVRAGRPTLIHLVVLPGKTYSRIYPL